VGGGLSACLVIAFIPLVHLTLFLIVPGLLIESVPLYLKYSSENANFDDAQGKCPHCQKEVKLVPYTDSKMREEIKLICPECGQVCSAV